MNADIWKFVEKNDKRSFQLIKFAINPESDYSTVVQAIVSFRWIS